MAALSQGGRLVRRSFATVPLIALLAACSGESPSQSADEAARQPEVSSTTNPDPEGAEARPPSQAASPDGYTSAYTTLDLDDCEVLDRSTDEGSWIDLRCPGLQGIPLFVSEGDGRFDVAAGVPGDSFATIMAFNDLDETVEWRMQDGEPFAVIFRYRDVSLESGPRTVLAIEKIGRPGAPGCRVAQIAGATPRANERARMIADQRAAGFDCSAEPYYVGDAR